MMMTEFEYLKKNLFIKIIMYKNNREFMKFNFKTFLLIFFNNYL